MTLIKAGIYEIETYPDGSADISWLDNNVSHWMHLEVEEWAESPINDTEARIKKAVDHRNDMLFGPNDPEASDRQTCLKLVRLAINQPSEFLEHPMCGPLLNQLDRSIVIHELVLAFNRLLGVDVLPALIHADMSIPYEEPHRIMVEKLPFNDGYIGSGLGKL